MDMKCIVCTQLAYFRQDFLMILVWVILLGLSKKTDAGEKAESKFLKSELVGITFGLSCRVGVYVLLIKCSIKPGST